MDSQPDWHRLSTAKQLPPCTASINRVSSICAENQVRIARTHATSVASESTMKVAEFVAMQTQAKPSEEDEFTATINCRETIKSMKSLVIRTQLL